MTGVEFLTSFITTGRLHGIGIGSTLAEVDRALPHRCVDVVGGAASRCAATTGSSSSTSTPGRSG
ncbi:hypothetical protein AB0F20_02200 [Streptomyces goshikiensis]|uniref:hypothetical protein n=1 Tax=Streptomyces goshikiensis TaxID=1942 RepID=UPI0033D0A50B